MWKNDQIHLNSNGMCGVCLGEIYNLILDTLCKHDGREQPEGEAGGKGLGACSCVSVYACADGCDS